jgi:two-component system, chemotaxis family, CheB/CheR fusion protein
MAKSQKDAAGTLASPLPAPPPVCAIGASAGGVRALQDFFGTIGDDLGLAYVVVVHLSPDHPSRLAAILGGCTRMPIEQVGNFLSLRPNCVYIIAPDRDLVIEGENLASRPIIEPRGKRSPIDTFFRSLAAARRDALAVVLSGAGSDGALGIRAMKEAGGVVFVQDPGEAEYPAMPRNAIATGVVDFVAPIPVLVHHIAEVVHSKNSLRQLNKDDAEQGLLQILRLLHTRTGHDFSHYKRSTVMRRVARRMQVTRHDSIRGYVEYLRGKPQEAQELLAELLISVTSFFRDHGPFETVAKAAIRSIYEKAEETGSVRVWVVGCATGEEAYSVAILLLEEAARSNVQVPIQVFASDLDEKALTTARQGRYPKTIAADVSQERLCRFFVQEDDHYRIRREVRELVLFAKHDALKDPPFMRNDLITCRNLLIYLDRKLQRQLCGVLHYALRPDGYLFLGSAENADSMPELFHLIDQDAPLYAAKRNARHAAPVLPQFAAEHHRPFAAHDRLPPRLDSPPSTLATMHLSALERQSPPSALVDADYRLRHLSPNAGRFIRPSGGTISDEVWELLRPELRLDVKLALQRAFEHKQSTLTLPIIMKNEEGERRRVLAYVALTNADKDAAPYALILFLDAGAAPLEGAGSGDAEEKQRLVQELTMAQERLDTSQRQYAQAVQELRASNEELQSINEEHRSISEQLETSKEELQSINEELKTVNAELKTELDNVSSAHSDLRNLVAETEIGTLFLDRQLRIKLFTPPIAKYFNVTQNDLNRAVTDFTHRLIYDGLRNDAERALETLVPMQAEVKTRDDTWLMMRMRPYRTVENVISGIVVTFTDITELKRVEDSLAAELDAMGRLQRLSIKIVESTELEPPLNAVLHATMELIGADSGNIQLYDSDTRRLRIAAQRGFDQPFLDHFAEVDASHASSCGKALATRRQVLIEDVELEPSDWPSVEWAAAAGYRAVQSTPLVAGDNRIVGMLSTHFREPRHFSTHDLRLIDICARQAADSINAFQLQESLRKSETRLRQVLETETVGVFIIDQDGAIIDANRAFLQMTGYSRADVDARGLTWRKMTPLEWIATTEEQFNKLETSGHLGPYEKEYFCSDGSRRWMLFAGRKLDDGTISEYCIDISDRKRAERDRELLARELSHRVKNTLAVVEALAQQTSGTTVQEFREKFSGRVRTLSQAHSLLLDSDWRSVHLDQLLEEALSAYRADDPRRAELDGAPISVTPKQALGLRLIVHELATNAVKYGALSTDGGAVRLSWRAEQTGDRQRRIRLRWEERGGPKVTAPEQTGFGAKLIKNVSKHDLEGEERLDYTPEGLICEIAFPTA